MANPRAARQARRRGRGSGEAKLNITSMMDMFTIILVFLLKSYSTEGTIVAPADNLTLPNSTVQRHAKEALSVKVAKSNIMVESRVVIDADAYAQILDQKDFMIEPLYKVLVGYSTEARKASVAFGKPFSGEITIQGDVDIPYKMLTRVMYTCGQAGYPNMNLFVYKKEQ